MENVDGTTWIALTGSAVAVVVVVVAVAFDSSAISGGMQNFRPSLNVVKVDSRMFLAFLSVVAKTSRSTSAT